VKLSPRSLPRYKRPLVERACSWLTPKQVDDVQRDPRTLSLAFSLLFGSGALLVLFSLLLPHSADRDVPGLVGAAVAAVGVVAAMITVGRRCPMWVFRALPFGGAALVSVVSYSGGEAAVSPYAMFYFWVILAAFYFFPGWWGVANLASVGLQYAFVARASGTQSAELKWVMLMGSLVVGAMFLTLLQEYAERATAEREKLLAQLEQLAVTDALTSLPNRRAWQARLVEELRRAARQGTPLALVIVDIDGLKQINDAGGHQAGDSTIKRATAGWKGVLRETDFIARLGGDEFGVLLPNCPEDMALLVLEKMRVATRSIAWSAGIAIWDGKEHARGFLERADTVLYEAKRGGRNRALTADPAPA